MLPAVTGVIVAVLAMQLDTTVSLGRVERDLTGDGQPETLRIVGTGISIDSLDVTFYIESSGRVLFQRRLAPVTRSQGFGSRRRRLSDAEYRDRLETYARWFFDAGKFMQPEAFIEFVQRNAPGRLAAVAHVIERSRKEQLVIDSLVASGFAPHDAEKVAPTLVARRGAPYDTARAVSTWEEIQRTGVTVFSFSHAYDAVAAIAWSARDRRFYRLFECC
jgi:hypothetical protein